MRALWTFVRCESEALWAGTTARLGGPRASFKCVASVFYFSEALWHPTENALLPLPLAYLVAKRASADVVTVCCRDGFVAAFV